MPLLSSSPSRRALAVALLPVVHSRLVQRIAQAADTGIVLSWNYEAQDVRVWPWPTHTSGSRRGAAVAASGLRVHLPENNIDYPICLHGKFNPFSTADENRALLREEQFGGKKRYKFVCRHNGNDEKDCFYEVLLPAVPPLSGFSMVFNPLFQFTINRERRLGPGEAIDGHEDDDYDDVPPELMAFHIMHPGTPPQVPGSDVRVDTRALLSLNSPTGLDARDLAALARLLQQCIHCDVVMLPAAMRMHIRGGRCKGALKRGSTSSEGGRGHGSGAGGSGQPGGKDRGGRDARGGAGSSRALSAARFAPY